MPQTSQDYLAAASELDAELAGLGVGETSERADALCDRLSFIWDLLDWAGRSEVLSSRR
jgi:hypothetical protein